MKRTTKGLLSIVLMLIVAAPISAWALEQQPSLYNNGAIATLGKLSADYEGAAVDAFMETYSTFARSLDSAGWDFRWLMVVTSSTRVPLDASGTALEFPYVYPPAGNLTGTAKDNDPFLWDNDVWPERHTEGSLSYYGFEYISDRFGAEEGELVQVFLVLTKNTVPNKMVLVDKGSFAFLFSNDSIVDPIINPYIELAEDGYVENSQRTADDLEIALANSGFGDWEVVPSCRGCAFSVQGFK